MCIRDRPFTAISKEYNFSYAELRKACVEYNVPIPKNGHWQKLKYGKGVNIISLPNPEQDTPIILKVINIDVSVPRISSTDKYLTSGKSTKLSKPHEFIVATKRYHKEKKAKAKKRDWSTRLDETDVLSINVSDNLFSRSLRLMDVLIKTIEAKGYELSASNRTVVSIRGQEYNIRLAEKHKQVKRETNHSWDSFDLEPTGNLVLRIDRTYPIKEWSDTKTKKLEDKLSVILEWLELRAKQDELQEIESKAWRESYEKQKLQKEKLQKRKAEEIERTKLLLQDAKRYIRSKELNEYIKQFESKALLEKQLDEEVREWIKWGKAKADWIDPFKSIADELLGEFPDSDIL